MTRSSKTFKKRSHDAHKGDYGHVLVVAGSTGMTGAAYLASEAAVLTGSGLVTCATPKSLNAIMEIKLTEAMTFPVEDRGKGHLSSSGSSAITRFSDKTDVAAIGPGIGQHNETKKLIATLIRTLRVPIVLDADGINCIASAPNILKRARTSVVITPHPGELSRLLKKDIASIQRNRKRVASETAKKFGITVVLKGKGTVVASSDGRIYVNKTGNPGMASGGVGDVLTGMVASLIGQGFMPFDAAECAVYLHGLAGDIAARTVGEVSLKAQHILDYLPMAIQTG